VFLSAAILSRYFLINISSTPGRVFLSMRGFLIFFGLCAVAALTFVAWTYTPDADLMTSEEASAKRAYEDTYYDSLRCEVGRDEFPKLQAGFKLLWYHRALAKDCFRNIETHEEIEQFLFHHLISEGNMSNSGQQKILYLKIYSIYQPILSRADIQLIADKAKVRAKTYIYRNYKGERTRRDIKFSSNRLDDNIAFMREHPNGYNKSQAWGMGYYFGIGLIVLMVSSLPYLWPHMIGSWKWFKRIGRFKGGN